MNTSSSPTTSASFTSTGSVAASAATARRASELAPGQLEKFRDLVDGIHICMLGTYTEGGDVHIRPMAAQQIDEQGCLWFFTYDDDSKVGELGFDDRVVVSFTGGNDTYVVAYGSGTVSRDRAKIDELWSEEHKAWFPDGKDTPNLALIRAEVSAAEYWDRPGGKVVTLWEMAKAAITGQPDQTAEHGVIGDLKHD